MRPSFYYLIVMIIISGCEIFVPEKVTIDEGLNIKFILDEGLNDDPNFRLQKIKDKLYLMNLPKETQNIQRISVRLLDGDKVVTNKCCGSKQKIEWRSNLYWWLKKGETVGNITKSYFNPFTGELQYSNLPPLVNWKDELIPTINANSYTDELTGRANTVLAPIGKMRGDTMTVYFKFSHEITKTTDGSMFYTPIGYRDIVDSVKIILK
jgi:hypothetical protein